MGIIFLDEIDKIASSGNKANADVSREGVQRDILPIVEGSKVNTRYGIVDTSHILFIAAGAFGFNAGYGIGDMGDIDGFTWRTVSPFQQSGA